MGRIREYAALSSGDPRHKHRHHRGLFSSLHLHPHLKIPRSLRRLKLGRALGIGALAIPGLAFGRTVGGLALRGLGGVARGYGALARGLVHRTASQAGDELRQVAAEFNIDPAELEAAAAQEGALTADDVDEDDGDDYGDPYMAMGDPRPGRSGRRPRTQRGRRSARGTPTRLNLSHLRALASGLAQQTNAGPAAGVMAGMAGTVGLTKAGRPRRIRKDGHPWKRPSMNATNVHALRRAMRRVASFDHIAARARVELGKIARKAHHGHAHIPAAHHRRKK